MPDHAGKSCSIPAADRPIRSGCADVVSALERASGHEFWPDVCLSPLVEFGGVVGHRQVTDAYLAQLARSRNGQLATLDSGLAHLHSDVAVLIPPRPDYRFAPEYIAGLRLRLLSY